MTILNHREISTVLAALRFYQANQQIVTGPIENIATDDRQIIRLSDDEIDDLCERINCS